MTDARPATDEVEQHLPLTPPELHVLLALGDDVLHGYAMIEALETKTDGRDTLLPGTLYATLARMTDEGLLEPAEPPGGQGVDERRRYYRTTPLGRAVARAEAGRLRRLVEVAESEGLAPETG